MVILVYVSHIGTGHTSWFLNWHMTYFMISDKSFTRCRFLCGVDVHQTSQQNTKILCGRIFNSYSPEIPFVSTIGFYRYECLHTYRRRGILRHFWKKIIQLLWKVVTYLLKTSLTSRDTRKESQKIGFIHDAAELSYKKWSQIIKPS